MIDDRVGDEAARDPVVGSFIGKYQIVRVVGTGGMGVLYEARHPLLASRLAIKTLRVALASEGAERFRNEALAASRLRDDRLPQIFDIDELPDGTPFIVMELLEGEDLSRRLSRGALEPKYAARLTYEVLELLGKVHTLGIIHRDLKPANVFIAWSSVFGEIPKLLDFGVAHMASHTITDAGQVLGTPAYMAPEQMFAQQRIGPWTDVFSVGVMLFELIAGAGERPWVAHNTFGYMTELQGTTPPRSLVELAPWTPPRLWTAIGRALERDPTARYADALEFARAIEPFAADRSVLYAPRSSPATPTPPPPSTSVTTLSQRAAVQKPVVAGKLAEVRDALARIRPRAAGPAQTAARPVQLQPGERRLVVVVCLQLQLQRGAGPSLGAEDEEQLMLQALDLFAQELSQQGVEIVGQPENGLVGIVGGERVQDDDVERAITAALAVATQREAVTRLLAEVGASLTTRIGVHRGFLSRRARGAAGLALGGETMEIARRLAESAPLNGILASGAVTESVRDWLSVQPASRVILPGRARAFDAYEVLGTVDTAATPDRASFVGREAMVASIADALAGTPGEDAAPVVVLTGPPGTGKTRLAGEAVARLGRMRPGGVCSLRVQPLPRVSYGLWAALVDDILACADAVREPDAEGDALDLLASALGGEGGALLLRHRATVESLVGRGGDLATDGTPQHVADRIEAMVSLCLDAAARLLPAPEQSLVVTFDNLHRADPASLSLVPKVIGGVHHAPRRSFVFTARAALLDDLPRQARVMEVGPLTDAEAMSLVTAVAAPIGVSPAVHRVVAVTAAGNPLFIQQLVVTLAEDGMLGATEAELRNVAPPVSLYGLFLERVDRLEPALAELLRIAGVLGVEFERELCLAVWARATATNSGSAAASQPSTALEELVARGFIVRRHSGDTELYAFNQAPMQTAVYGTVLAENRQILHALAAQTLEKMYAGRLARHYARIFHHYSHSGDIERTVHYGRLAGERALAIAAYDEAAEQLGIAAGLQDRAPGKSDIAAAATLHRLATAFEWKGQLREAAARAEEADARLDAAGPGEDERDWERRRAQVSMTLGELHGLLGAWQRSIEAYDRAERSFAAAGMPVEAAEARCCRGFSHRAGGQPERGVELARAGWSVLEASSNLPAIARAGHEFGNLLRDLGRYEESLRIFDRAIASGDALRQEGRLSQSMWGSIASRSGRAITHAAAGDLASAVADQREANELARRDGNRVAQTISEYHLAAHYLELGNLDAADESAARACRQSQEIGMPGRAFKSRLVQARVRGRGGDWNGALERLEDALLAAERGLIPDDALSETVALLAASAAHVPQPALARVVRVAWPHLSRPGRERLRAAVAELGQLVDVDSEMTGDSRPAGG